MESTKERPAVPAWVQTRFMAFMDCFYLLGVMTLITAPLMILTRGFRVSGKATAAH